MTDPIRVHLVAGGFPAGQHAGHDMDYARLRLLGLLQANENVHTTVSGDFTDCDKWLADCRLLVTYVAGPYANDEQTAIIEAWLAGGGRWVALHGSCGGKAVRTDRADRQRRWVKEQYHHTLGGFFLMHPPIREMRVSVEDSTHPLMDGLPETFTIRDEPYMVEILDPESTRVLLTTKDIDAPASAAEIYGSDTSLLPDGESRALGFIREVGRGAVAYFAPGHTHSPLTNVQTRVHESVSEDRLPPKTFRGVWETDVYAKILDNAVRWGTSEAA